MRTYSVGLLGLGTVGGQVARRLIEEEDLLTRRAGARLRLASAAVRDTGRARAVDLPGGVLTTDPERVLEPGVDIVVELLGGEIPAADLLARALAAGRHVVTANKLVIARHGPRLSRIAREAGAGLLFEAAVGGGIPVIGPLVNQLAATRLTRVEGIVNSTTNFILGQMSAGLSFDASVREAQRLGYAEADPSSDVDGWDAAYKISILASLAFEGHVDPDAVRREGISAITPERLAALAAEGRTIRVIATGRRLEGGVEVSVAPREVPLDSDWGRATGSTNVFVFEGDMIERVTISGLGAGGAATANAVVSNLVEMVRSLEAGVPARVEIAGVPLAAEAAG